jgi:hypothetical protein
MHNGLTYELIEITHIDEEEVYLKIKTTISSINTNSISIFKATSPIQLDSYTHLISTVPPNTRIIYVATAPDAGDVVWVNSVGLTALRISTTAYTDYPTTEMIQVFSDPTTANVHSLGYRNYNYPPSNYELVRNPRMRIHTVLHIPLHDPMNSLILPLPEQLETGVNKDAILMTTTFFHLPKFHSTDIINTVPTIDDYKLLPRERKYDVFWRILWRINECSPNVFIPSYTSLVTPWSLEDNLRTPDLPNCAAIVRVLLIKTIYARDIAIRPEERALRVTYLINSQ